MRGNDDLPALGAEDLRQAFDRAFAEPERVADVGGLDLLDVRIGGDGYALQIRELGGLFSGRKIVRLPSPLPEFLGLTGLRGGIVPVYSLRDLLGYPAGGDPRWIVLAGFGRPLGLAFDEFLGHLRLRPEDLVPQSHEHTRTHVRDAARVGDALRPLLSIRSIADSLPPRIAALAASKEQ